MEVSDDQEKTIQLLCGAADRAERLAILDHEDADDYFHSMGILDDEALHLFAHEHCRQIMQTSMLMNPGILDVPGLMGTAFLFGVSVGYQMALMREESA